MHCWPRVILLGDSLTQHSFDGTGWGGYVANLVKRKCDVINRGFSGYTTEFIMKIIDDLIDGNLVTKDVACVTIFFGANDATLSTRNQRQSVPLEKYEINLEKIIDRFQKLGVDSNKIILIAPPAVDEKAWLNYMIENGKGDACDRSNEVTGKFASACQRVAELKKCRLVNLWEKMMTLEDYKILLSDGLHFTDQGNLFLAKLLESHVTELTQDLPIILPLWDEFPM